MGVLTMDGDRQRVMILEVDYMVYSRFQIQLREI